ncbi:small terminase subunit [Companilactobacillus mishanensis]|uniref:Small terminase subunit n=1 Tax=Companilactobacillus mishanensis TaxID=2486008 RepID=A0A5P0ZF24_9LACO|nr:small terminase subunit [Companilactobacillus mishanensis]MQS44254.1 small terminase subunit [Companilactobacillus mishanensis]MQS51643.1 small terminase subunit [Companilactobacillus mishanensis]
MAKGQYKEWLKPDKLVLLHGWKLKGLTDEDIASNVGVAPRTFERWKAKYSQIRQAIKTGKDEANFVVENALFRKAREGNNTAMIFWLKNNYRDKYSDSQKTPLEEELTRQQIRRVRAEADMAKAKADLLTGAGGDSDRTILVDDIGGNDDNSNETEQG